MPPALEGEDLQCGTCRGKGGRRKIRAYILSILPRHGTRNRRRRVL